MAKDTVCGMTCEPETAVTRTEYKGQTYYFCAPGCKAAFEKDPEKYIPEAHAGSSHHQRGGGSQHQHGD